MNVWWMSALVGEHDQLDLYPVTKLLIMVGDLRVLFTSEMPSFLGPSDLKGGSKAAPSTIYFKRSYLFMLVIYS